MNDLIGKRSPRSTQDTPFYKSQIFEEGSQNLKIQSRILLFPCKSMNIDQNWINVTKSSMTLSMKFVGIWRDFHETQRLILIHVLWSNISQILTDYDHTFSSEKMRIFESAVPPG